MSLSLSIFQIFNSDRKEKIYTRNVIDDRIEIFINISKILCSYKIREQYLYINFELATQVIKL